MLISYLHNFIFIKTQKTGGTTVEVTFANFCGPDDVVTPLGKNDELARSNGEPICRNFDASPELEKEWIASLVSGESEYRQRGRKSLKFYAHMRAKDLKPIVDPVFWERAFKFTTERHPYEKVVSKAFFLLGPNRAIERLPKILDHVVSAEKYLGSRYYAIEGNIVVDQIVKLENLAADLSRVAERIGVTLPEELPRMKSISRRDPRPAREILSQEHMDHIYRVCKQEFDLLGYEP